MNPRYSVLASATLLSLGLLAGCGGGGNSGSESSTNANANNNSASLFSIDPASITPTAATTDKPFQYPNVLEFYAYGSSCRSTAPGQAVLVSDNTVTYSDGTATPEHMKRAAQYAEASVRTLRDKFGISAPGNIGFDGQKVRVCASISGSSTQSNGSAGIRTLHLGTPEGYSGLGKLAFHETTHMVQAQALNCQTQQYGWERWLTEGMALRVAGQDGPSQGDLSNLQAAFSGIADNLPFGDMDQRVSVRSDRYPGYRLAVDTLLGETGKTELDLYRFLKQVGTTSGCPGSGAIYVLGAPVAGWKAALDASFGTDLRGTGMAGSGFWAVAKKYAK
jgi:hypothetical protein